MAGKKQSYLTVEQVADLLQVHWQTVLTYIRDGHLAAFQLGRAYRISQASLDEFIANRSTKRSKQ